MKFTPEICIHLAKFFFQATTTTTIMTTIMTTTTTYKNLAMVLGYFFLFLSRMSVGTHVSMRQMDFHFLPFTSTVLQLFFFAGSDPLAVVVVRGVYFHMQKNLCM